MAKKKRTTRPAPTKAKTKAKAKPAEPARKSAASKSPARKSSTRKTTSASQRPAAASSTARSAETAKPREVTHEMIKKRAHEIWLQKCQAGHNNSEIQNWLEAENELHGRNRK